MLCPDPEDRPARGQHHAINLVLVTQRLVWIFKEEVTQEKERIGQTGPLAKQTQSAAYTPIRPGYPGLPDVEIAYSFN